MLIQKKSTVLIIEDEAPIRKLLNISLESRGYKTIDCDSGAEGVRLVASAKPDIVILDLGLPDQDGKEAIKMIREWTQVPIIVCSVRNDDSEMIEAFNLGADDYMIKAHFMPSEVVKKIKQIMK